ncbi:hypothetical protein AB1Y20_015157 [Prymnesium parvum]|uniref:AP complex subunit sigma n=1 Tax=Prymnesium parvum TaxID=97485 RepID=A0AB34JXQ3_PRYPA
MILAFIIVNNFGRARHMKFYTHVPAQQQQSIVKELFNVMNARSETACNFINANSYFGPGARVVYRQYATLFFAFVIDGSESELGILDLIQVLVEVLDRHFRNVCELDLIFNSDQVHWVVDEMIVGGLVVETNMHDILDAIEQQSKFARQQTELGQAALAAQAKIEQFAGSLPRS